MQSVLLRAALIFLFCATPLISQSTNSAGSTSPIGNNPAQKNFWKEAQPVFVLQGAEQWQVTTGVPHGSENFTFTNRNPVQNKAASPFPIVADQGRIISDVSTDAVYCQYRADHSLDVTLFSDSMDISRTVTFDTRGPEFYEGRSLDVLVHDIDTLRSETGPHEEIVVAYVDSGNVNITILNWKLEIIASFKEWKIHPSSELSIDYGDLNGDGKQELVLGYVMDDTTLQLQATLFDFTHEKGKDAQITRIGNIKDIYQFQKSDPQLLHFDMVAASFLDDKSDQLGYTTGRVATREEGSSSGYPRHGGLANYLLSAIIHGRSIILGGYFGFIVIEP